MLRERTIKTDKQVNAAIKLVSNDKQYDKLLGRSNKNVVPDSKTLASRGDIADSGVVDTERESSARLNLKF